MKTYMLLLTGLLIGAGINAQAPPDIAKQFVNQTLERHRSKFKNIQQISIFYQHRHYRLAWMNNNRALGQFISLINNAAVVGLHRTNYQTTWIQSFGMNVLHTWKDSMMADMTVTDNAIQFFHDVIMGEHTPAVDYDGLKFVPACQNIPTLLSDALDTSNMNELLRLLEPHTPEYRFVKDCINHLLEIQSNPHYDTSVFVNIKTVIHTKTALIYKLFEMGILTGLDTVLSADSLKQAVQKAQERFGLEPDGKMYTAFANALNVPLTVRMKALCETLNTFRWLECLRLTGTPVVVVNIPSASLLVFGRDSILMESKIMVGRPPTPTPTLSSRITEVILFPYWYVPNNIASRELLPQIKRNPGYLESNAMQVLNLKGEVLDPSTINWLSLTAEKFPYKLRQSTGCDNSLGLVKFQFYNPFNVYLHDTPWKFLFMFNRRYFSHGCMRLEKAMELAHLLAPEKATEMVTLEKKGCVLDQAPVSFSASVKMPVLVLYHTAWINERGEIRFMEDIYQQLIVQPGRSQGF